MKISVENGKICNQTMMGERLEIIGEVCIVDEMDCFRFDFIMKMERRFRGTTPDLGAVLMSYAKWYTVNGLKKERKIGHQF